MLGFFFYCICLVLYVLSRMFCMYFGYSPLTWSCGSRVPLPFRRLPPSCFIDGSPYAPAFWADAVSYRPCLRRLQKECCETDRERACALLWGVMASGLTLKSFVHFEFIFACGVRQCPVSFCMLSSVCRRDCLFPVRHSCLLSHRFVDPLSVALFLDSLQFR